MAYYRYADLTVSSAFSLEELTVARGERRTDAAFTVHLAPQPPLEPAAGQWVHHWPSTTGAVSLSLAVTEKGYLLRFPRCADFVISADGRAIEAWPARTTSDGRLRQLLLNQVLPRLLGHTGRLTLHASAVRVDGFAIAFAAPTCGGKSTLAASLHLAGFPALTDDGLIVVMNNSQPWGLPLYTGLRLRTSSRAGLFPNKVDVE